MTPNPPTISPKTFYTPEDLAAQTGKSIKTIYRRALQLRKRNMLPLDRHIWRPDEAKLLLEYVLAAGRENK